MALIDFTPTDWNPGTAPGISADQLDRIEAGIDDLNSGLWNGVIEVAGGAEDAPGLGFSGIAGTGFYADDVDNLFVTLDSATVWRFDSLGSLRSQIGTNRIRNAIGSAGSPSFTFEDRVADGMFSPASGEVGLSGAGEQVAGFTSVSTYRVPNNPNLAGGQDIPGIDTARIEYSQAAFNASITTFSTRSSSILASQLNPHFRLASADSDTNPDKRIAIADEFFGTSGGQAVNTALSGGWWNFQRIVSTIAIKESVFPWNPALAMPATIPGPKQAGGAGATPFTPADLMDVTPVTYVLTPENIDGRGVDPGEMVGYIAEDVAAKAPWLLDEAGGAIAADAYRMAVVELIRDLRDRVTTLEP